MHGWIDGGRKGGTEGGRDGRTDGGKNTRVEGRREGRKDGRLRREGRDGKGGVKRTDGRKHLIRFEASSHLRFSYEVIFFRRQLDRLLLRTTGP